MNVMKKSLALVLCLLMTLSCFAGCRGNTASTADGSSQSVSAVADKTITVKVVHKDGTENTLTVNTDADNLRGALEPDGVIAGDESEYGLFVKTVDGETADDANEEWWCITKGGEMLNTGVDDTQIADGESYEFTLTVGY